ncbi:Bfar [Symbiodinium natans]|uniref:Bfar protein n=1 Tax=Symbiodinium natans TaxID=878477 RepID=A0A812PH46_9DINO|nr:Bfar [Symbiodinium natans]
MEACYESYLHSSAAQFRRRECPLCKKPVSSRCPEAQLRKKQSDSIRAEQLQVSVLLRDAISREMFEELEAHTYRNWTWAATSTRITHPALLDAQAGVVRRETLDFLLAREDTGSLLQLLSLFTTAMTREAQTVQDVGIQLAFKELSKALLALLSQEPVLNTGYCTLLEVLQQQVQFRALKQQLLLSNGPGAPWGKGSCHVWSLLYVRSASVRIPIPLIISFKLTAVCDSDEAVETLSQYWLEHLLVPSQQHPGAVAAFVLLPALSLVRGQFGQQVADLAPLGHKHAWWGFAPPCALALRCEASALLPQLSDGPVLRLAVLVLEAAVMGLAGARWQLQREHLAIFRPASAHQTQKPSALELLECSNNK